MIIQKQLPTVIPVIQSILRLRFCSIKDIAVSTTGKSNGIAYGRLLKNVATTTSTSCTAGTSTPISTRSFFCTGQRYYNTTKTTQHTVDDNQIQIQEQIHINKPIIDPTLVDSSHAPDKFIMESAVVYPNIIQNISDMNQLELEIQLLMKRRRYEKGHWDSVIVNYKETEVLDAYISSSQQQPQDSSNDSNNGSVLSDTSLAILRMIQNDILIPNYTKTILAHQSNKKETNDTTNTPTTTTTTSFLSNNNNIQFLPYHIIDLHENGQLNPHVDSVRYSGSIVAGLSLNSPSIMRLRPVEQVSVPVVEDASSETSEANKSAHTFATPTTPATPATPASATNSDDKYVDLLLPINSLYVLSGTSRYNFTHELLPSGSLFPSNDSNCTQQQQTIYRKRRLSVIFRDALSSS